jgi:hypothetical protein
MVKVVVLFFCLIILGCGEAENREKAQKKTSEAAVNRVSAPIERARGAVDSVEGHQSRLQKKYKSEASIQ